MTDTSFDLIDIIRTIQKRRIFIIVITLGCMALAGIWLGIKKPKYKAAARFLVNNPLYGDRMTMFRNTESRWVDFFGGDDDVDKVAALANSDTVKGRIIRNSQFQDVYKQDINSPKGYASLMGIFDKNFNLKRSEYKDMEASYIAYDPVTAANVANMSVQVLEEAWRNYYTYMKTNMYNTIKGQMYKVDSSIALLTDSLANMREKYGIYNIISPNRQNIISGDLKGSGKSYARGVEEIQNVEAVKDQLVTDKARYVSLMNEFEASTSKDIDFLKVTTRAVPPTAPTGMGMGMVLIAAALLGLFFSSLWVLVQAYYSKLNAVVR